MYILLAILVFGILIAVHELGHFLVAKACGVRVDVIGQTTSVISTVSSIVKSAIVCLLYLLFKFIKSHSLECHAETLSRIGIVIKELDCRIGNAE